MRFKDINECLQHGIAAAVIAAAVANAEVIKPDVLKSASDFAEEIYGKFYSNGSKENEGLPFLFGPKFPLRLRYREVTVWSGHGGHGKSQLLNHLMIYLAARHGERACVASFEMAPEVTYYRFIRQATGQKRPFAKADMKKFAAIIGWMDARIWVYHHQGVVDVDDVLSAWKYARRRYGIRQFVFDSLMMSTMDAGEEQYKQQNETMQKLCDFADKEDCHVHVVAHSKKMKDEKIIPRKSDIMGSSAIANKAFNVCIVWRNVEKEMAVNPIFDKSEARQEAVEAVKEVTDPRTAEAILAKAPAVTQEEKDEVNEWAREKDAFFLCDKQRNGEGTLPVKDLWFHRVSLQFMTDPEEAAGPNGVNYMGDLETGQLIREEDAEW